MRSGRGEGCGSDHAKIFLWIWYCVHRPTWVTMDTRKWPISPPISYTFPQKLSLILNKLTISPKWIFILKYIDLRTFVVKISRQGQGHGQGQGGPLSTYQTIYFVKLPDPPTTYEMDKVDEDHQNCRNSARKITIPVQCVNM